MGVITQFPIIADPAGPVLGTLLEAETLSFAVAGTCVESGGMPVTNGTLTLTQPATVVVVNSGTAAPKIFATAQSLTFTASKDTYVDLDTSATYHLVAVANNAAAPSVTANSIRLYKAVSNGSAVTSITQLGAPYALGGESLAAVSEAPSTAALTALSTLGDNIRRLWGALPNPATFAAHLQANNGASNAFVTVQGNNSVYLITAGSTPTGCADSVGFVTCSTGSSATAPISVILTPIAAFTSTPAPLALLFYSVAGGASGFVFPSGYGSGGAGHWNQFQFSLPVAVPASTLLSLAYLIIAVSP